MIDLIKNILYHSYEYATSLLPFAVCSYAMCFRRKDARALPRFLLLLTFALYIVLVFDVTSAGTLYELLRGGSSSNAINLIPFSDPYFSRIGYVLNGIMLMPLGFLAPLLWTSFRSAFRVGVLGMCFSVLIEISQLCNFRSTDVDDVILNTVGAVIGYVLYRICAGRVRLARFAEQNAFPFETVTYIILLFLGRFFLYDGMWLAVRIW